MKREHSLRSSAWKWLRFVNHLFYHLHVLADVNLLVIQHVGIRRYGIFLKQMYDLLDDDGIFVLQVAGIRPAWQFEDLIWYGVHGIVWHFRKLSSGTGAFS